MALNADAVRVAGTGEVYVGPANEAAPTSPTAAPGASYTGLGYTSTDGVAFTFSRDTSDIDAWQGSKVRVVSNAEPASVAFTLIETNLNTLPVVFGGGTVTEPSAGVAKFTPPAEGTNTIRSMIVDFDDNGVHYRYYFPRVQIEGDVAFSLTRGQEVGYSMTFGILAASPKWILLTDDENVMLP